jgi:hypothetical protein
MVDTLEILDARVLECHRYYLQVFDWNIPIKNKVRVFGDLVPYANPICWRIVGITKDALAVFANHDFRKVSRMGVNRGHLVDRNDTCTHLFTHRFKDVWEWWQYYYERDKTVLMTSSENVSGAHSEIFEITTGLFISSGFAWKHGKQEIQFLKELHSKIFN